MSIRLIARELYQIMREINELTKRIETVPAGDREPLGERLRKLKAEKNRLQRILEGSKDAPSSARQRRF